MRGYLRPQRSAAPEHTPPTRRKTSVTVPSSAASALLIVRLFEISTRRNVRIVKSNPSSIQPRYAAKNARHCSGVTSLRQPTAVLFMHGSVDD
jgi:hypothetical protein